MKQTFFLIIFTIRIFFSFAQTNLTADDILNKSIEFCGGLNNMSKIKSSRLFYDLSTSDGSHISLIMQREVSKSYMRSVLSTKHLPTSMHFDGTNLTVINGETKKVVDDIKTIEEIKLQTYNLPQLGYKELSYNLKRLDDQKFSHFNCYVVNATSENGYTTLNYFDKTNFRLIMIIYPKGNKSLLMEYLFKDGVLFNSKILNVEENSEQTTLVLNKLENNVLINKIWFQVDNSASTSIPAYIKKGTFISSDETVLIRTDSIQTEKSKKGDPEHLLFLVWFNNYIYAMVDSKSLNKKQPTETGDNIVVKIVSWNKEEYVCHYYSNGVAGIQEYRTKK